MCNQYKTEIQKYAVTKIRSTRIEDRNFKEGRSGRRLPGVGSLNARPVRGEGGEGAGAIDGREEGSERAREGASEGREGGEQGSEGRREGASQRGREGRGGEGASGLGSEGGTSERTREEGREGASKGGKRGSERASEQRGEGGRREGRGRSEGSDFGMVYGATVVCWDGRDGMDGRETGRETAMVVEKKEAMWRCTCFPNTSTPTHGPTKPDRHAQKTGLQDACQETDGSQVTPVVCPEKVPLHDAPGEASDAELGTDSSSSDGSTAAPAQRQQQQQPAYNCDVEVLEPENKRAVAAAFSPDADVVEVASKPGSSASVETQRHCKYQRRFRLVREPIGGDWTHDERADTVRKYFASAPRLPDPSGLQVALFKRVSQDIRRNPDWLNDEECSICMSGPKPKVVLSCGCRHKLFHIKCVQEWHEKEDASWQRPMNCPTCKAGAKPLNVGWVTPSATETAATQKERRKQRKKEKAKRDGRRNAAKKVKRNAKAAAEEKNRRDAEAVLAPGLTMKDGILHYR
ncbi:hypothetical protein B0H14DRAFT_2589358 [Mycena olivaceomarginata]|nr:hypothetical protein B0H14DRAFT_2589358 [Mycena olivaceomarginata]